MKCYPKLKNSPDISFLKITVFFILLTCHNLIITSQNELSYAKTVIRSLCHGLYGRGYVNGGIDSAASFIHSEFEKFGLKTFDENYYQDFEVSVNTFPSEVYLKFHNRELIPGEDYLVAASSPSINGNFKTYRIKNSHLLEARNLIEEKKRIRNKIIVLDNRGIEKLSHSEQQNARKIKYFIQQHEDFKHRGFIELTSNKLTWRVSESRANKPEIRIKSVDTSTAYGNVELNVQSNYIENYPVKNVVGFINGTQFPDSFLVLTAHYDHLGMMGNKTMFPGANDNASGIAMLLSLARHYSLHPPKYSVVFIAFASEELGLKGAFHFVNNPLFPLDKIKFLINFDLAGTGDDGIMVVNSTVFEQEFKLLEHINNTNNLLPAIKKRGAACNSDHCPFYKKNVPSFYIYTLGGIQAYHDIYDRYETLPLTEFQDYFKLIYLFLDEL